MSAGYPTIRPRPDGSTLLKSDAGTEGAPEVMLHGLKKNKDELSLGHPLEYSEKHYNENLERMDFAMLRNVQGLHAPLRLKMERQIASRVQRLPCLASSNIMLDNLLGRFDTIGFEDMLNDPLEAEFVGPPHLLMEKRLNLL